MTLKAAEERFWRAYVDSLPPAEVPTSPLVTAGHAGGPSLTDGLLQLYLDGTKTAGSSLLADFEASGDPVPRAGDHWILLDSDGEPRCILRTSRVELHTFGAIPAEVASAEGEGDLSVASWKRGHADLYTPRLEEWGVADLETATVVTEFFDLVFRGADPR